MKLLRHWAAQRRILGAVFLREIQTRWGRRNLAFAWVFAEPLVFAFPVLAMWSYLRGPFEHGLPMIALMWSGYLPILMFRHTTGMSLRLIYNNGALLYHSSITPFDIVIGRCGLELIGNVAAMGFSLILLNMLGFIALPYNYTLFLVGIFYMAWWSLAVAFIVAAWSERSELVEHIWPPISYMYLPVSGFFYLAEWLPPEARNLALTVMPSLHCYEMIRGGLFGNKIQTFYDPAYLTIVLALLTWLGLWLLRDVRKYLEVE